MQVDLMGKKSAPTFNANAAITAQTQANNQASVANARSANQFGPFGSATTQVNASGQPIGQTRTLNPTLQGAADNVQGGVAQASGWLPSQKFSLADVPQAPALAQAIYDQSMVYARPEMDRRRAETEEQLYNRGLRPGGQAYEAGMAPVLNAENRFIADASARATQAGYDQRQREIANTLTERNQGSQDANAGISLLSGMGSLMPQATPLQPQAPVNAAGLYQAAYQSDLDRYRADQQSRNALIQAGVGLLASPFRGGDSLLGAGFNAASRLFNAPAQVSVSSPWINPDTSTAWSPSRGYGYGGGFTPDPRFLTGGIY
jgi:hypothetical protein